MVAIPHGAVRTSVTALFFLLLTETLGCAPLLATTGPPCFEFPPECCGALKVPLAVLSAKKKLPKKLRQAVCIRDERTGESCLEQRDVEFRRKGRYYVLFGPDVCPLRRDPPGPSGRRYQVYEFRPAEARTGRLYGELTCFAASGPDTDCMDYEDGDFAGCCAAGGAGDTAALEGTIDRLRTSVEALQQKVRSLEEYIRGRRRADCRDDPAVKRLRVDLDRCQADRKDARRRAEMRTGCDVHEEVTADGRLLFVAVNGALLRFVWVEGGEVTVGLGRAEIKAYCGAGERCALWDAHPRTAKKLAGYWLLDDEVDAEVYARVVPSSRVTSPARYDLDAAAEFPTALALACRTAGYDFRLPSEFQFEHAALALAPEADSWKEQRPCEELRDQSLKGGVRRLLGGRWEWTRSRFEPYAAAAGEDAGADTFVVRGGGDRSRPFECMPQSRWGVDKGTARADFGFRVVAEPR